MKEGQVRIAVIFASKVRNFGMVVHGGAGSFTPITRKEAGKRREVLSKCVTEGFGALRTGSSAEDAVENAIVVLEDSGVFNAGLGSCLTIDGKIEPDAAIMKGDLSCGSVALASITKNPISLARAVMEKTDHVFLAGAEQLRKFARATNFPENEYQPTKARAVQYQRYLREMKSSGITEWPKNSKLKSHYMPEFKNADTVGAVALDSDGNVCAGVSTGGRWMKLPGRIGDSAVIGAGLYADDKSGAASATGAGEEIIRVGLCRTVCELMKTGLDAQTSCDAAISLLTQARGPGTAGVIAIDKLGRYGYSRNTEVLARAFMFSQMKRPDVTILPEDERAARPGSSSRGKKLKI